MAKKLNPFCDVRINYPVFTDPTFDDCVEFGLKFKQFLQKEGYAYSVNIYNNYTIYKEIEDGEEDS